LDLTIWIYNAYKTSLVDEDEYLLPLSRYIHLNPILTSRFKNADFASQ